MIISKDSLHITCIPSIVILDQQPTGGQEATEPEGLCEMATAVFPSSKTYDSDSEGTDYECLEFFLSGHPG